MLFRYNSDNQLEILAINRKTREVCFLFLYKFLCIRLQFYWLEIEIVSNNWKLSLRIGIKSTPGITQEKGFPISLKFPGVSEMIDQIISFNSRWAEKENLSGEVGARI